jgi:Na+/proline symporter
MLSFSPGAGDLLMPFLIIISLQWLFQMNSDGTGYLAQRMMACQTDRDARIAGLTFTWLQIFVRSLIWLIIGVGILVVYPFDMADVSDPSFAAKRELLFVTGINDLLPVGIRGIMLTGLLGALASTLDTHLNWGSSYWSNDIYRELVCKQWLKRESNSSELVWVARFSNILILLISLTIMFNLGSIQQAWTISLLFGAGMGSVLILRWLWERINLYAEIAAMATSLICAPIILVTVEADWLQLLLMSAISTGMVVLVSLATRQTASEQLDAFYQRVKPSGFWSQTAVRCGEENDVPRKKLWKAMKDTGITAISIFSLLVGFGKLMFRPTDESIWLTLILIVIGLSLIPWCIKSLNSQN